MRQVASKSGVKELAEGEWTRGLQEEVNSEKGNDSTKENVEEKGN